MESFLQDYLAILIFVVIAMGISIFMIVIPLIVTSIKRDNQKNDVYECGFPGASSFTTKFDVRFYLVAVLFLIFDLEVVLLFPWVISITEVGILGYCTVVSFLALLAIGFLYEWRNGALEWE